MEPMKRRQDDVTSPEVDRRRRLPRRPAAFCVSLLAQADGR